MSKIYAHIQMKDGEILGIVFNEEKDSGHELSSAFGDEVVCTTVEHDESTVVTYEIKNKYWHYGTEFGSKKISWKGVKANTNTVDSSSDED